MSNGPTDYTIRPAGDDDQAGLAAFFTDLSADLGAEQTARMSQDAALTNRTVYIAETDDGRVVGCQQCVSAGDEVYLSSAVVLPEARHQGVFSALLNAVVQNNSDCDITAEVQPDARHLAAMQRAGFTNEGESGGLVQLRMERK